MRVRAKEVQLPSSFAGLPYACNALYEGTLHLTPRSRVGLKVLVFPDADELWKFWNYVLHITQGREEKAGIGAVFDTTVESIDFSTGEEGDHCLKVDNRYFAVMGLVSGKVDLEVVAHEAGHAAYAYARRMGKRSLWYDPTNCEEEVCYPLGVITQRVNQLLTHLDEQDRINYSRHVAV